MSEGDYLTGQAKRCRALAAGITDDGIGATLRRMADDFERRAALLGDKPAAPGPE